MNQNPVRFRAFTATDAGACMRLFDANCPESFAPNEREEYADFLASTPAGYEVCLDGSAVVGAFGLIHDDPDEADPSLRWIMIDPGVQGRGIGSAIMRRVRDQAREGGAGAVRIAASHRSAPFFARFGAREVRVTRDGWGPGMHRHDMRMGVTR